MRPRASVSRATIRARAAGGVVIVSVLAWVALAAAQSAPISPAPTPSVSSAPTPADATTPDVESLRERAATFWAARTAGNFSAQWELLEPRGRGRMTAAEYAAGRGVVKYLAYQVEDASVKGYFATVNVRVLVQVFLPSAAQRPVPPSAHVVQDHWVRLQGAWYRTLDQDEGPGQGAVPR